MKAKRPPTIRPGQYSIGRWQLGQLWLVLHPTANLAGKHGDQLLHLAGITGNHQVIRRYVGGLILLACEAFGGKQLKSGMVCPPIFDPSGFDTLHRVIYRVTSYARDNACKLGLMLASGLPAIP